MNGTVIFGVALIIVGLFNGGAWMLPLLAGGVVVAAVGAFGPTKIPSPRRRREEPADEPWV
jgi:hypothetical protein